MMRIWWRAMCGGIRFIITVLLIQVLPTGVTGWPEGTYGLPMSKMGCPVSHNFQWESGRRTHQTEMGSHGSKDIHLAGIYSMEHDRITQSFCMKTSPVRDDDYTWQPGRYCIYKYSKCPSGFKAGWIYWDDAAPFWGDTKQNFEGTVPDGEYDRNTKIFFCCRNDGTVGKPITLPTEAPFHLVKWGSSCQMVKDMAVLDEWVYWKDEQALNLNAQGGLHPMVSRSKYPTKFTKLYYCYYTPKPAGDGLQKALLVVYVIAGAVGTILIILFFMCIIQRLLTHKPKEYEENNLTNARRESERHQNNSTEPVVYYTAQPQTSAGGAAGDPGAAGVAVVPGAKKRPLPDGDVVTTPTDEGADVGGPGTPDETTPMLPPGGQEGTPAAGSPVHPVAVLGSPAGSPVHMVPATDVPVGMLPPGVVAMRPISQPPTYEEAMRDPASSAQADNPPRYSTLPPDASAVLVGSSDEPDATAAGPTQPAAEPAQPAADPIPEAAEPDMPAAKAGSPAANAEPAAESAPDTVVNMEPSGSDGAQAPDTQGLLPSAESSTNPPPQTESAKSPTHSQTNSPSKQKYFPLGVDGSEQ